MVDGANHLNKCFRWLAGNKESIRLSYSLFPYM
ncbi:hypothetical protein P254_01645 [Acinetobacter oleivorans CIP 110421]|nr:hypothetical protein P254_01645 [Acinetobacter oleivorans CIP 110421]